MAIATAPEPVRDESRFDEIFESFSRPLWGYLYRAFCRADPESASDLMQETFLRGLAAGNAEAETEQEAKVWLFRIARQVAIDAYRKRRALRRAAVTISLDDAQALQITAPGDPVKDDEVASVLEQLELLPRLQREILLLWAEDNSFDEIAAITGESVSSVKSLRLKAIYRTKTALDRNETIKRKKDSKYS